MSVPINEADREAWIQEQFSGWAAAGVGPSANDPYMSMAVAKDITRKALAMIGDAKLEGAEIAVRAVMSEPEASVIIETVKKMLAAIGDA